MKILILILLPILTQVKATLSLTNGQFINNAPSGRDWTAYKVNEVTTYEVNSDTSYFDDSQTDKMTYSGKWVNAPTGCQCSYSNTLNDSLVFIFTDATYFEWRGELMSHHGIADIYFDGKYIGPVDTYDARNISITRNWKAEKLDTAKVYKFKLVVTGKKNTLSAGAYIVNHGFRIINEPAIIPPVVIPPIVTEPTNNEFQIIRNGRFQVYLDGVLQGEHNEYEKAIERAVNVKSLNKTKEVKIVSPDRVVLIK